MSTKIGPIQTGEEKPAEFDFVPEKPSGDIVSAVVTIRVTGGVDPTPENVLVGLPVIASPMVTQRVAYRIPGVTYLLQCTGTDEAGYHHTVSASMSSRAVA